MNVCLITCFHGRADKIKRIVRFFLDQDHRGNTALLLYNNASVPQKLDENLQLPENKRIVLVNNDINRVTNNPYTNVGDIFRDALTHVPPECEIVNHFDSDDIFLPNHVSEGVRGMIRAYHLYKWGYKPAYSWFLNGRDVELARNNMEPSIFVDHNYLKQEGYHPHVSTYHQKWLDKLRKDKKLLDDVRGIPTLLYDWSEGHNTFKNSGLGDRQENFYMHREFERNFGDGIISPISEEEAKNYYNITNVKTTTHSQCDTG